MVASSAPASVHDGQNSGLVLLVRARVSQASKQFRLHRRQADPGMRKGRMAICRRRRRLGVERRNFGVSRKGRSGYSARTVFVNP